MVYVWSFSEDEHMEEEPKVCTQRVRGELNSFMDRYVAYLMKLALSDTGTRFILHHINNLKIIH
jgi:hypothetical protein